MEDLHDAMNRRTLAAAAQWLGFGVAALPVLDIADRSGLLVLLSSPSSMEAGMLVVPLLKIAFFVAVGVAASALLRRHRPAARGWFFAGCVIPVLVYVLASGLRLTVVIALVALCFSFVQLRLARNAPPLA